MPTFSHAPLQIAIYQYLKSDSVLSGLVGDIYDRVPQNAVFPYITIGDISSKDWSGKTFTGGEYSVKIHVWSREGGRKQAAGIMGRLYNLLHQGSFSVSGHTLVLSQFTSNDIKLRDDGWTYEGVMIFRMILQSNS